MARCIWPDGWLRLFVALGVLACATSSWGAPTTAAQAGKVAQGWRTLEAAPLRTVLGGQVGSVETFADGQGQPLYYIVHLIPSGLLIVPADDQVEPILGFAAGSEYDPSEGNPLGALVGRDMAGRVAAARAAARSMGLARGATVQAASDAQAKWRRFEALAEPGYFLLDGSSSVSDVRVGPLLQSRWSQSTVGNITGAPACYNYYTPPGPAGSASNYVAGCTATAAAQILRFWQFPKSGIGVHAFQIGVDGTKKSASTRGGDGAGGPYDWSQMVLVPDTSTTLQQCQAIGALCYDVGVAAGMDYAAGWAAASTLAARDAMIGTFGYANAIEWYSGDVKIGLPVNTVLNANLDAGLPVLLGLSINGTSGHAVVADGYGYTGATLYHHLNMGWSGTSDAWYNLPDVATSNGTFNGLDQCVYNIFVSGKGEIISGRVTDSTGNPVGGVTVTAKRTGGSTYTATSGSRGVYAIWPVPSASTYTVTASATGYTSVGRTATTGTSADYAVAAGNCWGIDFTGFGGKPAALVVSPTSGLTSSGTAGGPFAPSSVICTLNNPGVDPLQWTAEVTHPWVTLSKASGTLAAGATDTVTVSLGSAATSLAAGSYTDTVSFKNTTNSNGNTDIPVSLAVAIARPDFVVTSISLGSVHPATYSTFTATVTVKNQGVGSGNAGYLSVWGDKPSVPGPSDAVDVYQLVGDLAPGESKSFPISGIWAAAAGAKVLRAFADSTALTVESDENNNQATLAYTVGETLPTVSIGDPAGSSVSLVFPVWLSAPSSQTVTVAYATADGTARAGTDYTAATGILTIPAGQNGGSIEVSIRGVAAEDLTFAVNLSNPVNATLQVSQATGTIQGVTVIPPGGTNNSSGCSSGVGAANLIGFYVLCWAGLASWKRGYRCKGRSTR